MSDTLDTRLTLSTIVDIGCIIPDQIDRSKTMADAPATPTTPAAPRKPRTPLDPKQKAQEAVDAARRRLAAIDKKLEEAKARVEVLTVDQEAWATDVAHLEKHRLLAPAPAPATGTTDA